MAFQKEVHSNIHIDDLKIISCPIEFVPQEGGLGYEFFMAMKKNKHRIAQYIADENEVDTFESMLKRSVRTAIKIKSKNLEPDDIICLCTYNHVNSIIPFLAATFLGQKVCSLDPSLSQADTTHLINQVKPKIFFVVPSAIELIENSLNELELEAEIVVFGHLESYSSFEEYLEESIIEEDFEPVKISDLKSTAVVFFSSGTTGFPKGICQNHFALIAQAVNMINYGNISNICLSYSSLYWISAVLFLSCSILSGTARVVCSHFDPEQFWFLLEKYKVTFVFLAPNQATDAMKAGRPEGIDTSSLNMLLTGGASMSAKQILDLRDILPGTFVCQAYGQTEVGGVLTCFRSNDVRDTLSLYHKPESSGKPIPGISYKIVDPETEETCGKYERGELRIHSNFVMNGYFNMDSTESFDDKGWLKTGDIVYYDEEFCFFVVDRIKEMLKFRSWHVAPAVLEKVVALHPSVKKVVVIGIPDEEDGDHPMALVVLNDKEDHTSEEDIKNFVDSQVDDRQKLRGGVKFILDIPLTPTGKVKRKHIRSLVLENKI